MRLKVKGILYDSEQVENILRGEKEISTFLTCLDNERPLDKIDLAEQQENSDIPLSDCIMEIEY